MRLLRRHSENNYSLARFDGAIPPYAVLSHRWGEDIDEVTFEDITNGTGKDKAGYRKIQLCAEQAIRDGLEYFWVDTCCIDKGNYAELSHAINSMFRWYRDAARCYVYLSDISTVPPDSENDTDSSSWQSEFRKSEWFSRGWTLQELLAPSIVEFFSQNWIRVGDKKSLMRQIHEITGIPDSALQGKRLSSFSDYERFSWMERRQTKKAVDRVYALLGIFDVNMMLNYDEGAESAFKRLQEEIDKLKRCLQDLRLTDPRHDKKRIEDTKGGLLKGSYRWVLQNTKFCQWRDDPQSRLLWIQGDPGKGKTMLLCGIIDELEESMASTALVAYFFCQATDSRINSATAVLRGLVYLLADQQPSLASYIRTKHDYAGKALFEDANSWVALREIFTNILQDPSMSRTHLIVDALDECVVDRQKLLDLIVEQSTTSRAKWIVSSRNWPTIEQQLAKAGHGVGLSLELNAESVSTAVDVFIEQKVIRLSQRNRYDNTTKGLVQHHLSSNANGTFLWVALVCQSLENIPKRHVLNKLSAFPSGLDSLYEQMVHHMINSDDADLCREIIALAAIVYRPLTLQEMVALVENFEDAADDSDSVKDIIGCCGSFLTIREDIVYFVHQSAKDFVIGKAVNIIFPSGIGNTHHAVFVRSLQVLFNSLQRDMYNLGAPGYPIERVAVPDPDPLGKSRYSSFYWVDHLCSYSFTATTGYLMDLQDGGIIDKFLRQKYLYWLEALSLCESMPKGVESLTKLEALIHKTTSNPALLDLVKDARRFIMSHKVAIEEAPLQAYVSALVFSPRLSLIRNFFEKEAPPWISIKPPMAESWSACLQTLEGHRDSVRSIAFSPNSMRLASASGDKTVKLWDASSGACLQTLEGHSAPVNSVAFSPDSTRLASASGDRAIKIWDIGSSGTSPQTLECHDCHVITSVTFSPDSTRLAWASNDGIVKIWSLCSSGACVQTIERHNSPVYSVAFSPDSTQLASPSDGSTIRIWDVKGTITCLQTLEGHMHSVTSVAFSADSTRLASASTDMTVRIWNTSGACLRTLVGHTDWVRSVAFSPNSMQLASGSDDLTVRIWDVSSGGCIRTLKGHRGWIFSVSFSYDSMWLASASSDRTVKVWDASSSVYLQTLESKGHSNAVDLLAFSHVLNRLASASEDCKIKIWDVGSGTCLHTLEGHSDEVEALAFSHDPDSSRLASGSHDSSIKVWDASGGACLLTLEGHSSRVLSVAFSHDPDSSRLASGSSDCTVKIWDTISGTCLLTLEGHTGTIISVAFSYNSDSKRLASVSFDNMVKIWDVSSGLCLQTLNTPGYLGPGNQLSFNASGSCLFTDIGTLYLDRLSSPSVTTTREIEASEFQAIALSSDRKWITYNSQNAIWIPSEYRPCSLAISEDNIAIGTITGSVWMCKIESHGALNLPTTAVE